MNIAIQGQDGSFHAHVARQWFGDTCTLVPCLTFRDVFEAFESGEADAIVTAIENTVYGSINEVHLLVEDCSAPIVGEVKLQVKQQLIGLPGTRPQDIEQIYSHPVALAQCHETLTKHCPQATLIEFADTAAAVEYVAELGDPTVAAIASAEAASLYGLPIITPDVHDADSNLTRFLVLENRTTDKAADRASLVITTSHKPGALVEVLEIFAHAGVNLAKLQSQPIVGKPWSYKFFIVVDCAGEPLYELVRHIEKSDHEVILLGEYKRA